MFMHLVDVNKIYQINILTIIVAVRAGRDYSKQRLS